MYRVPHSTNLFSTNVNYLRRYYQQTKTIVRTACQGLSSTLNRDASYPLIIATTLFQLAMRSLVLHVWLAIIFLMPILHVRLVTNHALIVHLSQAAQNANQDTF